MKKQKEWIEVYENKFIKFNECSSRRRKFSEYGGNVNEYAYNTSIQELDGKINVIEDYTEDFKKTFEEYKNTQIKITKIKSIIYEKNNTFKLPDGRTIQEAIVDNTNLRKVKSLYSSLLNKRNSKRRATEVNNSYSESFKSEMEYRSVIIMEIQKAYEIFTDASFDDVTKIGTYAIVIMQENKILKIIAKKCNIQLENSTECEVFAIFQAINLIQGSLLKKNTVQKFWLRTDCVVARDFFIEDEDKVKLFEGNLTLSNTIKQTYERIKKALSKKDCSFRLRWIPREINKVAHKHSYSAFQKLKMQNNKNNIILLDKYSFLELLKKVNSNYYKVISYLFQISNEEKLILKTQSEIAKTLEISTYNINKIFKQLIKLNILGKIKNGKYIILI